jgi:hypothetical protein
MTGRYPRFMLGDDSRAIGQTGAIWHVAVYRDDIFRDRHLLLLPAFRRIAFLTPAASF